MVFGQIVAQPVTQPQIVRRGVGQRAHRLVSWPRQGDRSQCRQVDFGVEGGGGQIAVTKYLADIDKFHPAAQHLSGQTCAAGGAHRPGVVRPGRMPAASRR